MKVLNGFSTLDPALDELLAAWGHPDQPAMQNNACEQIKQRELACFNATGDLQDLIGMNRPVAINLGNDNRPNWITLIAVDDALNGIVGNKMVLIQVSGQQQWIDQMALIATGEHNFTAIWRTPTDYQQPLTLGNSGASVDWLVNRLTQIESNENVLEAGYIFDLNLERRVKAFQLNAGINSTGIAGPRTWIALNDSNVDIPKLRTGDQQ
jgi:general secretion pathway protein A